MLPDHRKRIEIEFEQLHQLVERRRGLLDGVQHVSPNDVELDALAALLHSFYTGVEKTMVQLSKGMGEFSHLEHGGGWHQVLIRSLAHPTARRPAVLSEELFTALLDYLEFRHVFRHAYTFELKWGRMRPLVLNLRPTMTRLEEEVRSFLIRYQPTE